MFRGNDKDRSEFLPALAEIEERPLNPLGRFIFWTIVLFIFVAGAWMFLAKTDTVISSRGEVVSGGGDRTVTTPYVCMAKDILCKPGELVVKGQPIVTMVFPPTEQARTFMENRSDESTDQNESYINVLNQAEKFQEPKTMTSPFTGYVSLIYITAPSQTLMPGDPIMTLTAAEPELSFETFVSSADIGKIHENMPVKIKIDAYNFQNYGMLNGEVKHIALMKKNRIEQRYKIISVPVKDDKTQDLFTQLSPGMTTTVEMVTGKKRIIEFFVYPLVRYMKEGTST